MQDMYTVMIVDDEKAIRDSLPAVINFEAQLNDEFHRIIFPVKEDTRYEGLVQWNAIKGNTKIHTTHNK